MGRNNNDKIRDEALKRSWGLGELREEGMKMESAARSGSQMSNESSINKVVKYSNLKGNKLKDDSKVPKKNASNINCFTVGVRF